MNRIAVVVAFCLTLWGCGYMGMPSMQTMLPLSVQPPFPVYRRGASYKVGVSHTAYIGLPMVKVYNAYSFPAYKPKCTYQPPQPDLGIPSATSVSPGRMPLLTPDQKWTVRYIHDDNFIIYSKDYSLTLGIEISPDGELANREAWIDLSNNSVFRRGGIWESPTPQLFEEIDGDLIKIHKGSFKAELIYTGKMNKIITVSYREYVDNMARPAFYQELRYDLSEGNEITFKTLKMKVLEATNTKITIQVIDDGGLS